MGIDGVMASQMALTQAQVKTEISTRLLKMAQEMGSPQQMLELVQDTAEAATRNMQAAGGVDVYA